MDAEELREWQDPETWDEGELRPPVASPRAVVAVPFDVDDFAQVVDAARRRGLTPVAFVQRAALDLATRERAVASVVETDVGRRR